MAGMQPSPTGGANPYGQINSNYSNPIFDNIMRYQLGRQGLQSNERSTELNTMAALRQGIANNPGNQTAVGPSNQTAIIQGLLNSNPNAIRNGIGVPLNSNYPLQAGDANISRMRAETAKILGEANKLSRTTGQAVTNEGQLRPMTPQELAAGVAINKSATPQGEVAGATTNTSERYVPGKGADGNYGVDKQTTEIVNKVKAAIPATKAEAIIQRMIANDPKMAFLIESGYISVVDNPDGTVDVLAGGQILQSDVQVR